MANFLFYRYHFEHTEDKNLFSKENRVALTAEDLNHRLYEDFRNKYEATTHHGLTLYAMHKNRKGEESSEKYQNEIMQIDGNVILLQIRNNKSKEVMPIDRNEAEKVGHFPYCWVIIDSRVDSQTILIQYKKEIFKNPDLVIKLLTEYILREHSLLDLGWTIIAEKRICKGSIWDIVRSRICKGQDKVKSVTLKFGEKRPNEENEVDKALQLLLEKLDAPEGELMLTSGDPAKRLLDETQKDIRRTIDLLIENQYRMRVGFYKSGSVEYGKKTEAIYGIDDKICSRFADSSSASLFEKTEDGGTTLQQWLDTIIHDESDYEYIQPGKHKINGRKRGK